MKKVKWFQMVADRPYAPYSMNLLAQAIVSGFKKTLPESKIKICVNYWNKTHNSLYFNEEELKITTEIISKKALKSPEFLYRFFRKAYEMAHDLRIKMEKINTANLAQVTDSELIGYINSFSSDFSKFYAYGAMPVILGYASENPIYQKMEEIITRKTANNLNGASEYLMILTNPPKRQITQEQEEVILEIAKKAKTAGVKNKKNLLKEFRKDLELLINDFSWLSFDFGDKTNWGMNHYVEEIWNAMKTSVDQKLKELKNYEKNTQRKFETVCKKLKLTREEVKIFELVRNMGYYKWVREYEFQKALYLLKPIQDEIGRRYGFGTLEIKFLLSEEIKKFPENRREMKKKVKARMKNFLVLDYLGKTVALEGKRAKIKFEKLGFETKSDDSESEIKGMVASSGFAKGIVKIINTSEDMKKMKKGDILVSQATTPTIISAMKKAAAIVTNEGGIVCHAAIVSRELKIPCVIGTKIATKVLKDGDLVEVDANHGIIKIIN